jgi:hypothetical protein
MKGSAVEAPRHFIKQYLKILNRMPTVQPLNSGTLRSSCKDHKSQGADEDLLEGSETFWKRTANIAIVINFRLQGLNCDEC